MRLTYKNELFKKIQEWGYNANLFTIENTDNDCLLTLNNSPLIYHIANDFSYDFFRIECVTSVSYTHLRDHETNPNLGSRIEL